MIERLLQIDRRIIFLCVFLGVAIPLLVDFHFAIEASREVRSVYAEFERVAALDDPIVLLSFSYGAGTEPEMQPMARAVLRHCFRNDIKVVALCLWPDAPGLAQPILEEVAAQFGKTYGVDYAYLGYKPGIWAVIMNMGQEVHSAFPNDAWGTATSDLPLMQRVHTFSDVDLVFDLAAGDSIEFWWIPYGQEKYRFPFAGGCTAVMAPDLFPFLQSGQLRGLLGGLAGAAEYEGLIGHPAAATSGMRAQSVTHVIIVVFILIGNAAYFASRRRARA